jgi:hypothetical protein
MDLQDLFHSPKLISAFPGWASPEVETGYSWFDAPLEIDGVTEVGFVLHGGCYPSQPSCNVVLELRIARIPGRKRIPLARFEWRSLDGGHTNPVRKGLPHSGKRVAATHLHPFQLNYSTTEGRMKLGALRIAVDVEPEPADFNACLAFVGNDFRINNMNLVAEPNWRYDLFSPVEGTGDG